ncbi:nuclease-related domain-containing protein [Actinopolymorpha alba]|uniref:nuclease-related domain-containing protein n=1 Tax=Actinopolymorpha alba TaxID=533267 RepID=UPI00146DE18C|nr:nuclease-related domain-containing protein [Actinopolymorpha alba]
MKAHVVRWTRYGHDRLYVKGVNGSDRGYVDLRTGQPHPKGGLAWTDDIGVLVGGWLRENGFTVYAARWPTSVTSPVGPASGSVDSGDTAVTGPRTEATGTGPRPATAQRQREAREPVKGSAVWGDLAQNKPGQAALDAARSRTTGWTRLGKLLGFRTRDVSWRVGARGERLVGRTLWWARLLGWRTLHAVPLGRGDIDHVLIGPGGVLTVNTKHHRGAVVKAGRVAIFVRGEQTRYAEKARYEARRAAELLTRAAGRHVDVDPLVVIVGAVGVRGRRAAGVRVLTRSGLLFHLLIRSRRLDRETQDQLHDVARRSTTWQRVGRTR